MSNPFQEIHDLIDAAQESGKHAMQMVAQGASDDQIAAYLKSQPAEVLAIDTYFAHLAAYGMTKSHDMVVDVVIADLANRKAENIKAGTYRANIFRAGTPSLPETEGIRHLIDGLSHGMNNVTEPEYRHRDGRKRITEAEAVANMEVAIKKIIPKAEALGVDPELAFSSSIAVLQSNFALAAVLQRAFPQAFECDHKGQEWLELDTSDRHQRHELAFYDDLVFQRMHGFMGDPVTPEYGYKIWPEGSPLEQMRKSFHDARIANDEGAMRAAFNGKVLRPSQCLEFVNAVIGTHPQLVLPIYEATTAFNKQALGGYILGEYVSRAFWHEDKLNPAKDDAVLEVVDALVKDGADINARNCGLLVHVAQMDRMDIARRLVARGASIKLARDHAKNVLHTDESGGSHEYPYADAARRLNNLLRSSKPRANKGNPAP